MSSFFKRSKSSASGISPAAAKKKEETVVPPTPIQLLVQDAPQRTDGSDKFWGYENVRESNHLPTHDISGIVK
ncbi:hypothetical protein TWF696_006171 [Orbilia brochopaga]|uniref:Uncharacterized protein n=1 Tax=Orbilia brochopaga TaxID=3140254 RepID=A0AAV9UYS3_9PEZI